MYLDPADGGDPGKPVLTDILQVASAIALLAAGTAVAWAVIGLFVGADADSRRFLQRLFLAAVLLRAAIALGSYVLLPYGVLAPDEVGYVTASKALLASGTMDLRAVITGHGWIYFDALLFHIFGLNPLLPRFWNCLVGALTPILCFCIARRLGAGWWARLSAILAAFFPSLVVWSTLNLKDADVSFLVLAALLLAVQPREGRRWLLWRITAIGLNLLVLYSLRQFAAQLLVVAVIVALVASTGPAGWLAARSHPWRTVAAPLAAVVVIVLTLGVVFPEIGTTMFKITGLNHLALMRRQFGLGASSATNIDPGIGTLAGALGFLPVALVDFLLRPFPWEPGSEIAVLTRPETVAYYFLLLPAALGTVLSLRRIPGLALPLVIYLVVAAIGYGLVVSNLGTIYRERAPLLLVLFVFAGVAIGMLRPTRANGSPMRLH